MNDITLLSSWMVVSLQRRRLQHQIIGPFENSTMHNLNAPHKRGIPERRIPELKEIYACSIHGPTKCNQGGE